MSNTQKPQLNRIALALAIAALVDFIQLFLNALFLTGFLALPAECIDILIDCATCVAISFLLGFHWVLLPTAFGETIPGLDVLPTWTAATGFLVWHRKRQASEPGAVIDVSPPAEKQAQPSLLSIPVGPEVSPETRLQRAARLHQDGAITDDEYAAKRQQILSQL